MWLSSPGHVQPRLLENYSISHCTFSYVIRTRPQTGLMELLWKTRLNLTSHDGVFHLPAGAFETDVIPSHGIRNTVKTSFTVPCLDSGKIRMADVYLLFRFLKYRLGHNSCRVFWQRHSTVRRITRNTFTLMCYFRKKRMFVVPRRWSKEDKRDMGHDNGFSEMNRM